MNTRTKAAPKAAAETPIERLAAQLKPDANGQPIHESMLVPEQCMQVWLGDAFYHVTIEPMP